MDVFQRIGEITQPALENQAEQLSNDIIENQNIGNNGIYPGLAMFNKDIIHPQVEEPINNQVIDMSLLRTASAKINQLKQELNEQTRQQIKSLVLLMFRIRQKAIEKFRWSYIVEVDNMGPRPILGRATGAKRNSLREAQVEYDRITAEAYRNGVNAAIESDSLKSDLERECEYQRREEIFHPDDDDDEFNGDSGEVAFEVHRAAAEVGSEGEEKLLEVLKNEKNANDYPREPITRYVKTNFEMFINNYSGYDKHSKSQKKEDLKRVLDKLESAADNVNNPHNRKLIGNIVDFVMKQSDDFKDSYISSYIHDCANAYSDAEGDERLSCVGGIVERFYLVLAQYLSTICPGTKETCPPIYRRINKVLNKTAYEDNNELKNEFTEEWDSKHIKENSNSEDRKKSFIQFMEDKYKELYGEDKLEEQTIKMINDLANQYDYAFESGAFGGAKKRKTNKRKTNKRKTNKRKTNKKRINKKRG